MHESTEEEWGGGGGGWGWGGESIRGGSVLREKKSQCEDFGTILDHSFSACTFIYLFILSGN